MIPRPRTPGRYHVELVCLGNICRSPTAHVVVESRVVGAGLADRVTVTSSGTGGWHVGHAMDDRAAATLTAVGYDASRHRARQLDVSNGADLFLTMDAHNLTDALAAGADPARTLLFRDLDPAGPGDVPDPYYGGDDGFAQVLAMVERTADVLVAQLQETVSVTR